jgi:hypothetical protein
MTKANCFSGPALVIFTQLGFERFSEWKAALIDAATGKTRHTLSASCSTK